MGSFSALQEPSVEFGAIVAGGAGREVVFWDSLPRGYLLERLSRLAAEMLGQIAVNGENQGDTRVSNKEKVPFLRPLL